jgi:hypothetical protein
MHFFAEHNRRSEPYTYQRSYEQTAHNDGSDFHGPTKDGLVNVGTMKGIEQDNKPIQDNAGHNE